MSSVNQTVTAIEGIRVGHWTDSVAQTGCTVVLCPPAGCVASAAFTGPSPGTREAILLSAEKRVERIYALVFTGGSAFGLAAADGVVSWLEERGVGHPTRMGVVPLVPAAVIYDLLVGDPKVRPTAESGRLAAEAASNAPVTEGRVGAGAGAPAGKYLEPVPAGLGSWVAEYRGARVGAIAVVNPVGDVYDRSGTLVAGHGDLDSMRRAGLEFGNTTLVAVVTDAPISKAEARQLADAAQGAIAQVIRPSHTPWDGDSAFVLSTATGTPAPLPLLSTLVQDAVAEAIVRSVRR